MVIVVVFVVVSVNGEKVGLGDFNVVFLHLDSFQGSSVRNFKGTCQFRGYSCVGVFSESSREVSNLQYFPSAGIRDFTLCMKVSGHFHAIS
jgi:hypothetical protein